MTLNLTFGSSQTLPNCHVGRSIWMCYIRSLIFLYRELKFHLRWSNSNNARNLKCRLHIKLLITSWPFWFIQMLVKLFFSLARFTKQTIFNTKTIPTWICFQASFLQGYCRGYKDLPWQRIGDLSTNLQHSQ